MPGCQTAQASKLESEGIQISDKRVRVNEQIRISPVRLITDDGEQLGIVSMLYANDNKEQFPEMWDPVTKTAGAWPWDLPTYVANLLTDGSHPQRAVQTSLASGGSPWCSRSPRQS